MSGLSIGNGLSTGNGLSAGSGFSRGGGLYFSGFSVAPTLNLNFTTMTALPSTITFSRPSNATYYDSTGKLTYAPNNLLTYSNTLTNAAWGNVGGTMVVTGGVADQNGGASAWTLTAGAAGSNLWNYCTIAFSGKLIFSCWARRRIGTGTILIQTASQTNVTSQITSSWARISVAVTQSVPTYAGFIINVAGDAIDVADCQLEAVTYQTTPGTYNATTSAAYYGARLDYNPATLAARGLLIEEARTNIHPQSSLQSGYANYGGTLTANAATSIDGTSNAASFVTDLTTGQHGAFYAAGVNTTAATYTTSVYAKKLGPTNYFINFDPENVNSIATTPVFNLANGTVVQVGSAVQSAAIEASGNGFYRLIVTYTASAGNRNPILYGCTSTSSRVFTGDGVSGWVLFGFQVELGSFATSYIPTAASSVARSADDASMTGANFSSWYNQSEGTFVANSECGGNSTTSAAFAGQATTAAFSPYIDVARYQSGTVNTIIVNGSVQSNLVISASIVFGQIYKTAHAYKLNDVAGVANGGTVQTDTSATIPTLDRLVIGNINSTYQLNGHIAYLVYYPQRLPNATLQSLTT